MRKSPLISISIQFTKVRLSEDTIMSTEIQKIKEKHKDRFLSLRGVVSVGIGRDTDGKPAIIIGLDGSHPKTVKKLPKVLDGYPVRAEIIGLVQAH
jgi:hypothetical protein